MCFRTWRRTVQYLQGETALSEDATRALIRTNLSHTHFDFVRISDLQTSAGQQSRRGKAEFRVFTRGRAVDSAGHLDGLTTWSLGFQETEPGVWKVNRISPISMPQGILALPGGKPPTDGRRFGHNDGIGFPPPRGRGAACKCRGARAAASSGTTQNPADREALGRACLVERAPPAGVPWLVSAGSARTRKARPQSCSVLQVRVFQDDELVLLLVVAILLVRWQHGQSRCCWP